MIGEDTKEGITGSPGLCHVEYEDILRELKKKTSCPREHKVYRGNMIHVFIRSPMNCMVHKHVQTCCIERMNSKIAGPASQLQDSTVGTKRTNYCQSNRACKCLVCQSTTAIASLGPRTCKFRGDCDARCNDSLLTSMLLRSLLLRQVRGYYKSYVRKLP